ncbi:hypothetical protein B0T17DRAFT_50975 [Bombardia bombarda]|uniref:Secreted protein n=1 Tax=Bombardia bombarda TaxID=252184 RepID=A0AA39XL65_9PEZI|nr:hypothetical protein B0T17DRAFT_50975 [Bombardia bombarda]
MMRPPPSLVVVFSVLVVVHDADIANLEVNNLSALLRRRGSHRNWAVDEGRQRAARGVGWNDQMWLHGLLVGTSFGSNMGMKVGRLTRRVYGWL